MTNSIDTAETLRPGKRVYGVTVGIAMMDRRFPRPIGDMGNARSYQCPVIYDIVHGVSGMPALSVDKTNDLFDPLLASCQRLVDQGASAVTTTCGYAALLQDRIAAVLPVTFAASSLVQIPSILSLLPAGAKIGVIAARGPGLKAQHFLNTGVPETALDRLRTIDLQEATAFKTGILDRPGEAALDVDQARADIANLCAAHVDREPDIAAFVAECANVGPYSAAIQAQTNRPVWDGVSLVHWLHAARCNTFPQAVS